MPEQNIPHYQNNQKKIRDAFRHHRTVKRTLNILYHENYYIIYKCARRREKLIYF